MAGPTTESLDTDLNDLRIEFKELRADFHRFEVGMITSIAELEKSNHASIAELEKSNRASINRLELDLAKYEAVSSLFRSFALAALGTAITGFVAMIWTARSTSSRLTALEAQVGRLENRMERIEANIDRLIQSRFVEPVKAAPAGKSQ